MNKWLVVGIVVVLIVLFFVVINLQSSEKIEQESGVGIVDGENLTDLTSDHLYEAFSDLEKVDFDVGVI